MELRHLLVMKGQSECAEHAPKFEHKGNWILYFQYCKSSNYSATLNLRHTHENLIFCILTIVPITIYFFMYHLYLKRNLKDSLLDSVFAVHNSQDLNY